MRALRIRPAVHICAAAVGFRYSAGQMLRTRVPSAWVPVRRYKQKARLPSRKKKTAREVLGVSPDAPFEDIKKAFFTLAMRYHPDRNPDDPDAKEKFIRVGDAYTQLKEERKRQLAGGEDGTATQDVASKARKGPVVGAQHAHRELIFGVPQPPTESFLEGSRTERFFRWITDELMGGAEDEIHWLVKERRLPDALTAFLRLKRTPSKSVYGLLLTACSMEMRQVDDIFKADPLTQEMFETILGLKQHFEDRKVKGDTWMYIAIIRAFGRAGMMFDAFEMWKELFQTAEALPPNQVVNQMMRIAYEAGHPHIALDVFRLFDKEKMRDLRGDYRPDDVTYSTILFIASDSGLVDAIPWILETLKDNRIKPGLGLIDRLVLDCINQKRFDVAAKIELTAAKHRWQLAAVQHPKVLLEKKRLALEAPEA